MTGLNDSSKDYGQGTARVSPLIFGHEMHHLLIFFSLLGAPQLLNRSRIFLTRSSTAGYTLHSHLVAFALNWL